MRVRDWTVRELGEFGTANNDRDDVIFDLQDNEELRFLKEWLREKKIKPPAFKPTLRTEEEE